MPCRRPLFDQNVSATDFALMMGGKQSLPWELAEGHPLHDMDNADASAFIRSLLKYAVCLSTTCVITIMLTALHHRLLQASLRGITEQDTHAITHFPLPSCVTHSCSCNSILRVEWKGLACVRRRAPADRWTMRQVLGCALFRHPVQGSRSSQSPAPSGRRPSAGAK